MKLIPSLAKLLVKYSAAKCPIKQQYPGTITGKNLIPAPGLTNFGRNLPDFKRRGNETDNRSRSRIVHTGPSKQLPDLIYFPHVLRWLRTKFRFKYLQKKWDKDFSEGAFIYGSTQAICRITEIISEDRPNELANLVTLPVKQKLLFHMNRRLNKTQKSIIRLKPDDIKILVPVSVNFEEGSDVKKCRIRLRVLGLRWCERNSEPRLVLVALQTEFFRDYAVGALPEWTISEFDILECTMLNEGTPPS